MKAPQKSLKDWGNQDWTTKSGKKSSDTGERYLPKAAIKALSPAEYAATTRAKRAGKKAGKQFVKQPPKVAKKTAGFRYWLLSSKSKLRCLSACLNSCTGIISSAWNKL